MARDVLIRKLNFLRILLMDLEPYHDATLSDVRENHYEIERLFELLATVASDIIFHVLRERGLSPDSYCGGFALAAEQGLIPEELGDNLQNAAGTRNVIVHMYETIDLAVLHKAITPALKDFAEVVEIFESRLDE